MITDVSHHTLKFGVFSDLENQMKRVSFIDALKTWTQQCYKYSATTGWSFIHS